MVDLSRYDAFQNNISRVMQPAGPANVLGELTDMPPSAYSFVPEGAQSAIAGAFDSLKISGQITDSLTGQIGLGIDGDGISGVGALRYSQEWTTDNGTSVDFTGRASVEVGAENEARLGAKVQVTHDLADGVSVRAVAQAAYSTEKGASVLAGVGADYESPEGGLNAGFDISGGEIGGRSGWSADAYVQTDIGMVDAFGRAAVGEAGDNFGYRAEVGVGKDIGLLRGEVGYGVGGDNLADSSMGIGQGKSGGFARITLNHTF